MIFHTLVLKKKLKKCCLNKAKPPEDLLYRKLGIAHDNLLLEKKGNKETCGTFVPSVLDRLVDV